MMEKIMKYKLVENKYKPSDTLFATLSIFVMIGLTSGWYIFSLASIVGMFVVGSKKGRDKIDYKKEYIK